MIPRFNLNDINGIFAYSAISGLVLSIWISTGIDISDAGILTNILQVLANNLDYPFFYVGIIAIPFTVIEIIIIIQCQADTKARIFWHHCLCNGVLWGIDYGYGGSGNCSWRNIRGSCHPACRRHHMWNSRQTPELEICVLTHMHSKAFVKSGQFFGIYVRQAWNVLYMYNTDHNRPETFCLPK